MWEFAASTGLSGNAPEPRRYLWTDAFAVCNYLGFFEMTGDQAFLDLATKLVNQVHEHLAKHRKESNQTAWLSGLSGEEARIHPTCAGLRIGKPLDERKANEPQDDTLEWQQDGQYFHYLTRWMHALNCVGLQTRNPIYNRWARELAKTAHRAFIYISEPGRPKQMYWKMSIDLSRPLVRSMGHHDPLDGLVTYQQLEATAKRLTDRPVQSESTLSLKPQIEDFSAMCAGRSWATSDELGIGSMLSAACHIAQLIANSDVSDVGLLEALLSDSATSLRSFAADNRLGYPAEYRLAFREFGLAIGLKAIANIEQSLRSHPRQFKNPHRLSGIITMLQEFCVLHRSIVNFWLAPPNRAVRSWLDHADINNVMLATSLAPGGYLQA
jgi:hypothetical protein